MATEKRGNHLCLIISCLISLPLVLFLFLKSYSGVRIASWAHATQSCPTSASSTSLLPPVTKTFRHSSNISAIDIHHLRDKAIADDQDWEPLLLPSKAGLFWMKDDQGDIAPYTISMFHQLHCVVMLREAFMEMTGRGSSGDGTEIRHTKRTASNPHGHLDHCFHYLAQGILCSADETVELPTYIDYRGMRVPIIDGVESSHQCRDPSLLWDVVARGGSVKTPLHVHTVENGDTVSQLMSKIDEDFTLSTK